MIIFVLFNTARQNVIVIPVPLTLHECWISRQYNVASRYKKINRCMGGTYLIICIRKHANTHKRIQNGTWISGAYKGPPLSIHFNMSLTPLKCKSTGITEQMLAKQNEGKLTSEFPTGTGSQRWFCCCGFGFLMSEWATCRKHVNLQTVIRQNKCPHQKPTDVKEMHSLRSEKRIWSACQIQTGQGYKCILMQSFYKFNELIHAFSSYAWPCLKVLKPPNCKVSRKGQKGKVYCQRK